MVRYRVWAILIVLISTIQAINSAYLRCYNGSINNYKEVSLENASQLINTTYLDISRQTFMYTFGYLGKVAGPYTIKTINAYVTNNVTKRNICLLNWEEQANSGVIPFINYPIVVEASQKVAEDFAKAILELSEAGMSIDTLQLAGLSLGAHLCGYAGRELIAAGASVGQIIGLDPAFPEYDGTLLGIKKPLSKTDAKFVYIIHSDPGHYGMKTPTGTIDFFPNYGFYENGTNRQPGCTSGAFLPFSEEDLCSHNRALELLIESLSNPTGLQGSRAASYDAWVEADGEPNYVTYIGDMINTEYSGVYYLSTNSQSPFARGGAGLVP